MKKFVIGDIHGAYRSLLQCLERAGFDYQQDRLIVLGDVCDGYPQVRQCIDELIKMKHCDLVIGNHDQWALDWALRGIMPKVWTRPWWFSDNGILRRRAHAAGAYRFFKERSALD